MHNPHLSLISADDVEMDILGFIKIRVMMIL